MRSDERVARQVGQALRRIRIERRMPMKALARRAGIAQSHVSNYETGQVCPMLPNLVLMLQVLGCTAEEFGKHLGPWGCLDAPPGPHAA
jgi:transcriptional regulator with XRE-family HTH domain